jgi:iron complex transport system substrate-binding protein
MFRMHLHRLALPALAGVLFLTACGSSTADPAAATPASASTASTPSGADTPAAFPVAVTDSLDRDVELAAPPEHIVVLSPTATEMLFAIGAGDQVVAVDSLSTYPEEAPTTELVAFQPSVEAVSTYDPDLVILADNPEDTLAEFTATGIPTLMLNTATDLEDAWSQFELLGRATGHADESAQVVADLQDEIAGIVDATTVPDGITTYYHELDPTYYSVTSTTFIGEVYGLFGLTSIADEADSAGTGYPQLSSEYILEADPDLIFLADAKCCNESPDTVAARAGWDQLTAVQEGRVVSVDEDVVSRWGPRIVDFVRTIADAITGSS